MRVALVGARGAGKTSVGRILAERLGAPFLDTDAEIEKRSGCTIAELFEAGAFRIWEREVVADAMGRPRGVIALGGGAVLDEGFDAAGWTVVWLTAEPEVLAARVRADPAARPSLTGAAPHVEISEVLASRRKRYAELAQLTVATDTLDVRAVVESVAARLPV